MPEQKLLVSEPRGEAGTPHAHILEQAEIEHLILDFLDIERLARLDLVGLYASHIEGILFCCCFCFCFRRCVVLFFFVYCCPMSYDYLSRQVVHEADHRVLEASGDRERSLSDGAQLLCSLGPH